MPRVDFQKDGNVWSVKEVLMDEDMPDWSWSEDDEGINAKYTVIKASHIEDLREKSKEFAQTFLITGGCSCTCTCTCKCTCTCTCQCTCTNKCVWC